MTSLKQMVKLRPARVPVRGIMHVDCSGQMCGTRTDVNREARPTRCTQGFKQIFGLRQLRGNVARQSQAGSLQPPARQAAATRGLEFELIGSPPAH
jgi:hypothetical protein